MAVNKIKIARKLTLNLLRNPSRANEKAYDNFMNIITPREQTMILTS